LHALSCEFFELFELAFMDRQTGGHLNRVHWFLLSR
jgi:hypothetical protein